MSLLTLPRGLRSARDLLCAFSAAGCSAFVLTAAAQTAIPNSPPNVGTSANLSSMANAQVVLRMNASTNISQLRSLNPTAVIETPTGKRVRAGDFLRLTDALKSNTLNKPLTRHDMTMARPTGAAQLKIGPATNLRNLATQQPNTTIELPGGIKMRAGDLTKLDEFSKRRLGKSIFDQPARPHANALNVTKLTKKGDLAALKGRPDSTVVEIPNGARATLGELRALAAANRKR
jgi:hypothetical protein